MSGQIGIDPQTGDLVGQDIQSQSKRAMDNLKIFLDEVNVPMGDIIKCTVYLQVIFILNEAYVRFRSL